MKPTFSIVTVVYNNISRIMSTIDSVVNQSYKSIQYILIDGQSNDGTKEKILEYIRSVATITLEQKEKDILYLEATHNLYPSFTFKFLSEKDQGIYDAMNKGILLATQEWINFMNSGDRFYNFQILKDITNQNIQDYDIVYGGTEIRENSYSYLISARNHSPISRMPFCHQSAFVKTKILKQHLFNLSYSICSDNHLFTKLYYLNFKFCKLHLIISSYTHDGLSANLSWQMFYEDCRIGYQYNKLFPIFLASKYIVWTIPKRILKKIKIK